MFAHVPRADKKGAHRRASAKESISCYITIPNLDVRHGCLVSTMAVIFCPSRKWRRSVKRAHGSKLALGLMVVFSLALLAGKLDNPLRPRSAVAVGRSLGAPTAPEETAAPALDPAVYHHVAQVIWVVSDI